MEREEERTGEQKEEKGEVEGSLGVYSCTGLLINRICQFVAAFELHHAFCQSRVEPQSSRTLVDAS